MRYEPPVGAASADAPYIARNLAAGGLGSRIPARAIENPQREIVNAIKHNDLTPSAETRRQLAAASLKAGRFPSLVDGIFATKNYVFDRNAVLDGTFTRASTATYVDSEGIIRNNATGVPRFDADPLTGRNLGLTFENSRANAWLHSEAFDNAIWAKSGVLITPNAIKAPDGKTTADLVVADSGVSGFISQPRSMGAAAHSLSVFVKPAGRTKHRLFVPGAAFTNGIDRYVDFDLVNKTFQLFNFTTGDQSGLNAEIREYRDGWFRCIMQFTANIAATHSPRAFDSPTPGDGVNGVYLWGAQLEGGTGVSSYLATGTGTLTRSSEIHAIPGGEWLNLKQGTIFVECYSNGATALNQVPWGFSNAAAPSFDSVFYLIYDTVGRIQLQAKAAAVSTGVASVSLTGGKSPIRRFASAYTENSLALCIDGGPVTSANMSVPLHSSLDRLVLGAAPWSPTGNGLFGGIINFRYFPRRLPNETLQRMSAK